MLQQSLVYEFEFLCREGDGFFIWAGFFSKSHWEFKRPLFLEKGHWDFKHFLSLSFQNFSWIFLLSHSRRPFCFMAQFTYFLSRKTKYACLDFTDGTIFFLDNITYLLETGSKLMQLTFLFIIQRSLSCFRTLERRT